MNKHIKIILFTLVFATLLYRKFTWRIFLVTVCFTLVTEVIMFMLKLTKKKYDPQDEDNDLYSELR